VGERLADHLRFPVLAPMRAARGANENANTPVRAES
jgi:hypothetical protein